MATSWICRHPFGVPKKCLAYTCCNHKFQAVFDLARSVCNLWSPNFVYATTNLTPASNHRSEVSRRAPWTAKEQRASGEHSTGYVRKLKRAFLISSENLWQLVFTGRLTTSSPILNQSPFRCRPNPKTVRLSHPAAKPLPSDGQIALRRLDVACSMWAQARLDTPVALKQNAQAVNREQFVDIADVFRIF